MKLRFIKFKESCDQSNNSIIRLLLLNSNFVNTPIGVNNKFVLMHSDDRSTLCADKESSASLLNSLLKIRDHSWELNNFTDIEIEEMIHFVCTS